MNVAGLISSFATGTYTVTRTARGTTSNGKIGAGTASTFTVTASAWPASGPDLLRLPEARRTSFSMNVMTTTELLVGGQGSAYEADKISINGDDWEISAVDPWQDPVSRSTAYRCLATVIL